MSTPEDLDLKRRIFGLLAEAFAATEVEREAILENAEPELAAKVRALMASDAANDGFLSTQGLGSRMAERVLADASFEDGTEIGPYRLGERLGAGGMGEVYLAEQSEPVRRRVALKMLRLSLMLPAAQERFESERRAMERLKHPNVGRILDAGTTDAGVPYFAMELIDEGLGILEAGGEAMADDLERAHRMVAEAGVES